MKVDFVPLEASLLPACKEFNQRLRSALAEPPFELPEQLSPSTSYIVQKQHWVAVDDTAAVRGGVLLQSQPGWCNGQTVPAINIQSPLSEGIFDRRFSMLGLHILKFLAGRSPYLYAVGMGSLENPFAKLLAASRWQVALVPFYFHVIDGSAFLREIGPLRNSPQRRPLARLGAALGAGAIGANLWRLTHSPATSGYTLESVSGWENTADGIWKAASARLSFGVVRDEQTLPAIFPSDDQRIHRFLLRQHGEPVGWTAAYLTRQQDSKYFGNLHLATILDGLASEPRHIPALLTLTRRALADLSAQLVIVNHTHQEWLDALPQAGFLAGPSNYVAACSKASQAAGPTMQITRADGDGRIHL